NVVPDSQYRAPVRITTERSDEVAFVSLADKDGKALYTGTVDDDVNIDGDIRVYFDTKESTYKLMYKDKDGADQPHAVAKVTSGDSEDSTDPDTYEFTVENTSGEDTILTFKIAQNTFKSDGAGLKLGAITAAKVDITAVTYDRGGNEIKSNREWNAGEETIKLLDDLTITVDPAKFGVLSNLTDFTIGQVGEGAGVPVNLGNIAVANFANAEGLLQGGDGYFLQSTNSGEARAVKPGAEGTGNLRSSALEMSNVDLSKEFTEMITAQRGFQANTRMITVSDEMLSELISMKR
ncbi:MAG: flagellar hook-basal body complex protein, partial [Eubacteriales bacterium]|nr:flagellar hook-basal body complex protein [Eubacteriales bacterium]